MMMKDKVQAAFAEIHADQALMDDTAAYLHRKLEKRLHKGRRSVIPKLAGGFAAFAVLIAGIFARNLYFTADAHVSIDVNPSVELTLNRFDRVIATYAFNEDGERILSEADLRGKVSSEAAGELFSLMEAAGYFVGEPFVSITVQSANGERDRVLCDALRQLIDERVQALQPAAEVEVFSVSAEVWQGAHGCNMSPARYLAIQELLEVDEDATLEAYGDSSIRQIRWRVQECRNTHNSEVKDSASEADTNSRNESGHGQDNGNGRCYGHRGGH